MRDVVEAGILASTVALPTNIELDKSECLDWCARYVRTEVFILLSSSNA